MILLSNGCGRQCNTTEDGGAPLTKRLDDFIQAILLLSGCMLRVRELVMELLDGLLEIRDFAV